MKLEAEELYQGNSAVASTAVRSSDTEIASALAALVSQWKTEARKHTKAAQEEDCEIGGDEWFLHRESARIYEQCAQQLAQVRDNLTGAATDDTGNCPPFPSCAPGV